MKNKTRTFKVSHSLLASGLATTALSMGCIFLTESTQTVNPGPVPEPDQGIDMSVIITNPGPVDMPQDLDTSPPDMVIITNPGPVDMPPEPGPVDMQRDLESPGDMPLPPDMTPPPPEDMSEEDMNEADMPIIIINPGPIDMGPSKPDLGAIDPGKLPDMP